MMRRFCACPMSARRSAAFHSIRSRCQRGCRWSCWPISARLWRDGGAERDESVVEYHVRVGSFILEAKIDRTSTGPRAMADARRDAEEPAGLEHDSGRVVE